MLCAKFGWNWPSGSVENFKILMTYFRHFDIISPSKRMWFFIWTNLNSHHPRMLCAKLRWNWSNGSWRGFIYLMSINYFCYFRVDFINCQYDIFSLYVAIEIVSPHRTGRGFHLNKFYFPSPRMLCAEFLYVSIIFANFLLSRLGKGCDHSCEQTWTNLITHWRFMPNLVQIDLIVLEKMTKMWKV